MKPLIFNSIISTIIQSVFKMIFSSGWNLLRTEVILNKNFSSLNDSDRIRLKEISEMLVDVALGSVSSGENEIKEKTPTIHQRHLDISIRK